MAHYKKEQIKEIIEKTFQISQKNNGLIPIENIEQATSFASYIAGFPSWNHYKKNLNFSLPKKTIDFSLSKKNNILIEKTLSFEVQPLEIIEFENLLKKEHSYEDSLPLQTNRAILSKIPLGFQYHPVLKQDKQFYLDTESTIFVGHQFSLFYQLKSYLTDQNQCVIYFHDQQKQKEQSFLLNPLAELFYSDIYHDIFHQYSNHLFLTIWFEILQYIIATYHVKITAEFLLKSLQIDFLTYLLFLFVSKKNQLNQILLSYFKSIGVQIQKNSILFSIQAQQKHLDNIVPLQNLLLIFQEEYNKNTFSYDSHLISFYLENKKSIDFFIPSELPKPLFEIINLIIEKTSSNYKNKVEQYHKTEYCTFLLSSHDNVLMGLLNDYCIVWKYTQNYYDYSDFHQIVFLQHQSFLQPPEKFLLYFYQNTPYFDDNLFFSSGQKLIELHQNECYLWKKNKNDLNYFLSYELVKLNLKINR